MFSLFNNLKRNHKNFLATRRSRRKASRRNVLNIEGLEDRRMLSAVISVEMDVAADDIVIFADGNDDGATFASNYEDPQMSVRSDSGINTAKIDDCFACASDWLDATSNFGFEPLPAGFFEPGSEPFDGQVELGGTSGTNDTIVERLDSSVQLLDGPPETVPIEIVALSLASVEPVVIPAFNGPIAPAGSDFFEFPGFTGGVSVASGDVNADGFDDVIVGTGVGTGDGLGVFNDPVPADNDAVFANPTDTGNGGTASGTTLSTGTYSPESRYNKYIDELFEKLDYYREKIASSSLWERYLGEGSYDQENFDRTLAEIRSLLNGP